MELTDESNVHEQDATCKYFLVAGYGTYHKHLLENNNDSQYMRGLWSVYMANARESDTHIHTALQDPRNVIAYGTHIASGVVTWMRCHFERTITIQSEYKDYGFYTNVSPLVTNDISLLDAAVTWLLFRDGICEYLDTRHVMPIERLQKIVKEVRK